MAPHPGDLKPAASGHAPCSRDHGGGSGACPFPKPATRARGGASGRPAREAVVLVVILLKSGDILTTDVVVAGVDCLDDRCGAQHGNPCIGRRGPRQSAHAKRWSAWIKANRSQVLGLDAEQQHVARTTSGS